MKVMATKNNSSINIPLEGVVSEHCALIIDKGLNKVQGITSHKVELNNNRAVINTNGGIETLPNAVEAIRDLGYNVYTVKKNASNVQAIQGRRIKADYNGSTIHVGNKELFTENNNQLPDDKKTRQRNWKVREIHPSYTAK
jgi:cation transport ATPase